MRQLRNTWFEIEIAPAIFYLMCKYGLAEVEMSIDIPDSGKIKFLQNLGQF
jgi:hypothetical protein